MADNNQNVIKPVESLPNITGLTAAKTREERKKRQNQHEQKDRRYEPVENELKESIEKNIGGEIAETDRNKHSIDYRA
ncbi:MAG: hypothetical protein WC476_04925 [Phycisphaerae bacterium]|jgi:hypothetical protein